SSTSTNQAKRLEDSDVEPDSTRACHRCPGRPAGGSGHHQPLAALLLVASLGGGLSDGGAVVLAGGSRGICASRNRGGAERAGRGRGTARQTVHSDLTRR